MEASKHFSRKEFACNCGCGQDTVDADLLIILNDIRSWANAPVTVNSGNRCTEYNKKIGGAARSQHVLGRAADIVVQGKTPNEVHEYVVNRWPDQFGVGKYHEFTHVDSRDTKARWDKTNG